MYPILLAAGASVFFGLENTFIKLNVNGQSKASLLMARSIIGLILAVCLSFIFRQEIELWPALATVGIAGVSFYAFVFFYKSIEFGNASITSAISVSRLVIVTLISTIILNNPLTSENILFILMIMVGVLLLTVNFKPAEGKKLEETVLYAIISTVLFGIGVGLFSYPIKLMGAYNVQLFYTLALITFSALYMIYREKESAKDIVLQMIKSKGVFLTGLFGCLGGFAFSLSLVYGNPNIMNPVSSFSPIITAILSYILFKEKLTTQKYAGIVLTTLGVILLGYFR